MNNKVRTYVYPDSEKIEVYSPYNEDFIKGAKKLKGKWDGREKAWRFRLKDLEKVKSLCRDVYGKTGLPDEEVETVDIRFALGKADIDADNFYICGQKVAYRWERDGDVILAENVIIVEGEFHDSGGSLKYPKLNPKSNLILEIREVPVSMIPEAQKEWGSKLKVLDNEIKTKVKEEGIRLLRIALEMCSSSGVKRHEVFEEMLKVGYDPQGDVGELEFETQKRDDIDLDNIPF